MSTKNCKNKASERSPLNPEGRPTSYGVPYPCLGPPSGNSDQEYRGPHSHHHQAEPPSSRRISTITRCFIAIFLIFAAQLAVGVYFEDLPTKISRWNRVMARMREREDAMRAEGKHLEGERIALRTESTRLEKERIALDSSTLKMEGERQALESAIRHSEQERLRLDEKKQLLEGERSRLEKEKHLMENERQSLGKQELALKEERERWERARDEQKIPQGAFWEVVWPAWDCRSYGKREYWGILRNIPAGRSEIDACMNMPVEIKGVAIRRPNRCQYVQGSIRGFWMVDWDQPDCKPWHQDFVDRDCTNWGSGHRRIEAEVVGINSKGGQDWRLLCETTPMEWNHITYASPSHCEDRGKKIAAWDVPDDFC